MAPLLQGLKEQLSAPDLPELNTWQVLRTAEYVRSVFDAHSTAVNRYAAFRR